MPVSSTMGAAQTNINSSNIQLYGGRKVFADANAFRGDIQGMMAANREYNTYLTGLARLTGAGAGMLDKFWGIMLETQARDTETALSKAYRDMFTNLSLDEAYQGAGAMGLSNAFMERKQEVYNKFLEDNPNANKRILNNIDAQLQNRYYDRVGALQTDRLTQWHTQSKINNFAEMVDSASLSQLGDMNALADIAAKNKELFGNDPVRGRTLRDNALKTIIQAWAGQNPQGFLAQADGIKAGAIKIFGGSNTGDIDAVIQRAKNQVRADASFAMAVENHNRQMLLFQRKEESLKESNRITELALKAAQEGKPFDLNLLTPGSDGKRPIDKMTPADLAGMTRSLSTLGIDVDFNPAKREERYYLTADVNNPHYPRADFRNDVLDALKRRIITDQEAQQLIDKHTNVVNAENKTYYDEKVNELKQRAVATGDQSALQEMTDYMVSPHFQDSDYTFIRDAVRAGNDARDILKSDGLSAVLNVAQSILAPKDDLTGLNKAADQALYNQFVMEYYALATSVKNNKKMSWSEQREALSFENRQSEASKMLQRYINKRESFRPLFQNNIMGFTPTTNGMVPQIPWALRRYGGSTVRVKEAEGNPTGRRSLGAIGAN